MPGKKPVVCDMPSRTWTENRVGGASLRVQLIPDIARVQIITAPIGTQWTTFSAPYFTEADLRDIAKYITHYADELALMHAKETPVPDADV